jgi:hypothetical protein
LARSGLTLALSCLLSATLIGACKGDGDDDDGGGPQGQPGTGACLVDIGLFSYCMEAPTNGGDGGCKQSGGTPLDECPAGHVGSCSMPVGSSTYTAYFYGDGLTSSAVATVCPNGDYMPNASSSGGSGGASGGAGKAGGAGSGGKAGAGGSGGQSAGSGGLGEAGSGATEPPEQQYHATLIDVGDTSCAWTLEGKLMCWGWAHGDILGEAVLTPREMSGIDGEITDIHAGTNATCARNDASELWCWGDNNYGLLGDGTEVDSRTPIRATLLEDVVESVSFGFGTACGLDGDGGVWCWGNNVRGQLGDGTLDNRLTPERVEGLDSGFQSLAVASFHVCAIDGDGAVFCWGENQAGQLGDGTTTNRPTPVKVEGLDSEVVALTAEQSATCVLTKETSVWCWGNDQGGLLGDRDKANQPLPVPMPRLESGVVAISLGAFNGYALMEDGSVLGWGNPGSVPSKEREGLTADGEPRLVDGIPSGVVALKTGVGHACVLTDDGRVFCWGSNSNGELGIGTEEFPDAVVEVLGF